MTALASLQVKLAALSIYSGTHFISFLHFVILSPPEFFFSSSSLVTPDAKREGVTPCRSDDRPTWQKIGFFISIELFHSTQKRSSTHPDDLEKILVLDDP